MLLYRHQLPDGLWRSHGAMAAFAAFFLGWLGLANCNPEGLNSLVDLSYLLQS